MQKRVGITVERKKRICYAELRSKGGGGASRHFKGKGLEGVHDANHRNLIRCAARRSSAQRRLGRGLNRYTTEIVSKEALILSGPQRRGGRQARVRNEFGGKRKKKLIKKKKGWWETPIYPKRKACIIQDRA